MLALQIERLSRSARIERLVLATSDDPSDDPIAELGMRLGVDVFRGSLDDVLDRFRNAALAYEPDHVVRLTADCPLADWRLIDELVAFAVEGRFDVASNALRRTFPKGLDAEVVTRSALEVAWREATSSWDREHVLEYLYGRPDRFRVGTFEGKTDLSRHRWTVDEADDLAFVRSVYEALYPGNPAFTTEDVLRLLEQRPEIGALNAHLPR